MSTVLLVEDDATLRMLIAEALSMLEVKVLAFSCADEALLELESGKMVNLVLTDIRMPGTIDGLGLAKCIWSRWPSLPVILTSGHCVLDSERIPSGSTFIPKPWTLDVLYGVVESRLS